MERTSAFTDIDGPVHYVDYGGSGPAVVMLHGLGASHLNWDPMAAGLAADHHPFAVDLRGFGLTPLNGHDAALGSQVELVARFIGEIAGGEAIVFGNSMGGTIAMLLAAAHPNLVAGLVLFAPGLPPRSRRAFTVDNVRFLGVPLVPRLGESLLRRYAAAAPAEERVDYLIDAMTARAERIDEPTRAALIEMRRLRDAMEWEATAYCQALRSMSSVLGRPRRFRNTIHRITAPTLLIHGMLDDTVPFDAAEWLVSERPDWTFAPIADCGHVPHIELPERSREAFTRWRAAGRG